VITLLNRDDRWDFIVETLSDVDRSSEITVLFFRRSNLLDIMSVLAIQHTIMTQIKLSVSETTSFDGESQAVSSMSMTSESTLSFQITT